MSEPNIPLSPQERLIEMLVQGIILLVLLAIFLKILIF